LQTELCIKAKMMNKVEAMMKVLKILVLSLLSVVAIFVLVIGGYVVYIKYFSYTKATWHYVDELKIEKSEFRSEFEEIHEKVLGKYSLYESKHLNMDSMHNVFAKRIVTEVEDVSDFGLLLKEYFAALRTGHAKVCLDEYGVAHSYSDFVQYIEGRIFISHPNIYLAENGFKDKDEIVAINGIPTSDWIALNERYTSAPTEKYRKLNTALSVFNSVADTMRTYTVLRGDKQQKIRLALKKGDAFSDIADGRKSKLVDYKVFGNNIGYIEITSMTDSATEEFVKAFCKVKNQPFLIVDVRRNSGGSSGIGREICEYLIRKPQPHCLAHKYEMTPQPDAYKGRIFLLTSNHTFSAAESFVIDMKESGNATLVGETTGGDTGNNPQNYKTSHNIYFRIPTHEPAFSPKGFPLEGKGVEPHYEVRQTIADFLHNKDTVLEVVLNIIRKGTPTHQGYGIAETHNGRKYSIQTSDPPPHGYAERNKKVVKA